MTPKTHHRTILLNPGPVTLSERVRNALLREDQCHREKSFADLMRKILDNLDRVYPDSLTNHRTVALTGSGTAAVEAMLSSLAMNHGKTLVLSNGVYGERMAKILKSHKKPYKLLQGDWLKPLDLDQAETQLKTEEFTAIATVHNETTSGRLNAIAPIAELSKKYKIPILLDAVSSFGAEEIDFVNWNLLAIAATANKCLHGIPGIAFVLADKTVLDAGKTQSKTLYLDLFPSYTTQKTGFSPFTPSVHAAFALDEALMELADQGGQPARRENYCYRAKQIRQTLNEIGLSPLIEPQAMSSMISSYQLPQGLSYTELHDPMLNHGFVIYAGQGNLSQIAFRICNMGDIQERDLHNLKNCLKATLDYPQ